MTAGRLMERQELVDELEADAPWVTAEFDDAEELAPVLPIEVPRLKSVFAKLAEALEHLDTDDMLEMVEELKPVLVEGNLRQVLGVVDAWRVTAESLRDPLARSVLLGDVSPEDFESVDRPE